MWSTYRGNCCKKIISVDNSKNVIKFCNLHRELIAKYSIVKDNELCETFKEIKVVPRSHKHIKSIMSSIENEDDIVQVYLAGGTIEDADISNCEFIIMNCDNSKFYYNPQKGQNKAKNLKVILRKYCQNNSVVMYNNTKYCEECYKKFIKDSPRISLIT